MVYFLFMEFAAAGPRVLLADDHHFFREGLREILVSGGMVVVGEAHDGARAIKLTHELNPDIVVIDLKMPHTSGIDALQQIAAASPDARLVVLSVSADEADVLEALAAGACCYLLKDTTADGLIRSILLAADGHAVLSRDVVRALATRAQADSEALRRTSANGISLTAREREVIKLLAKGRTTRRSAASFRSAATRSSST